jgi:SAM-dependent methyltransferase
LEKVHCNICQSTKQKKVLTAKDSFTGEAFTLIRCEVCGLIYTNPRPTSDERHFYYPDFLYTADPSIEEKRRILLEYLRSGRILDVGSGRGFFLSSIRHKFAVAGVEIDKESSDYAFKKHGIEIIARQITDLDPVEDSFEREGASFRSRAEHKQLTSRNLSKEVVSP